MNTHTQTSNSAQQPVVTPQSPTPPQPAKTTPKKEESADKK